MAARKDGRGGNRRGSSRGHREESWRSGSGRESVGVNENKKQLEDRTKVECATVQPTSDKIPKNSFLSTPGKSQKESQQREVAIE